jgi:4-hydroxy-tetrahydrodipicolinate synthase
MPVDTRLQGILTALITPLKPDGETADLPGLRRVIDHVFAGGSTGIVALGGTGEFAQLSWAEREKVMNTAVEYANGRGPVIIGIVTPGLGDAKQAAQMAERAGADYLMPVTPYYVHGSQDGITEWYRELAGVSDLPMILYNIPARTGGVNLEPETVARMELEIGNIVGIKECSPSMMQFAELVRLAGDRLSVLAGEEFYAPAHFLHGARGAIMASANLVPAHWTRLYEAARDGRFADCRATFEEIQPLLRVVFSEPNPGPLKAAMEMLGLPGGPPVKPLLSPGPGTRAGLQAALERLGLLTVARVAVS